MAQGSKRFHLAMKPPAPVTQMRSFFSGQYGSKGNLASLLLAS